MGYNGPILPLCQEPCVEWWRVGSKLLTCQGNEMSVLTLVECKMRNIIQTLLLVIVLMLVAIFISGCANSGRSVSAETLDSKASLGRLHWFYRGSDSEYHYVALVVGVPSFIGSERREHYKLARPDLDEIFMPHVFPFDLQEENIDKWKHITSKPIDSILTIKGWSVDELPLGQRWDPKGTQHQLR